MKNKKRFTNGIVLLSIFFTAIGYTANLTQINRYATVDNKPLASQVNPLLTVQQIHFPQRIHTVGEALHYWLQYSGFSLASDALVPLALKEVMHQPLAQVLRNLGPLTVQDGLEVLVGVDVFSLVKDPLHRKVSFKLKPRFATLVNPTSGVRS